MNRHSQSEPRELELKLELAPRAARRLRTHRLLSEVPCETQSHEQVYFDTSDHDLHEKGYSLRVRRGGDRFVQTLKRETGAAGLFDRSEWEAQVEALRPEADALKGTPVAKKSKLLRSLQPVARSKMERSTWSIDWQGSQVEVVLDSGRVEAGSRREPIAELEIELKRGDRECLFELADQLSQAAALRISPLSKAERAYRLAAGKTGHVQKATKIELGPQMNVADAFTAILLSCLRHFRLNEQLILDRREPGALHQARVSMRRLRAALSLFGKPIHDADFPRIRRELRWFTGSLGDARNIDVFLKRHEGSLSRTDLKKLTAARERAYIQAIDAIDSDRLRRLLLDLVRWAYAGEWRNHRKARRPVSPFAAARLDRFWNRVEESGSSLAGLDPEQRHRLRIEVKKLRYAVEFLGPLFDGAGTRTFTRSLESVQESLGSLNDRATAEQIAADLDLDWSGDTGSEEEKKEIAGTGNQLDKLGRIGPFWAKHAKRR